MDKIIPFNKGIRRQPSLGVDGELSELVNLVPVNGELVNVKPMKAMGLKLAEGERLLEVHRVQGGDNYIVWSNNRIKYYYKTNDGKVSEYVIEKDLNVDAEAMANVIGNTLIILSSTGMHYLLWKNNGYAYLGDHIPELPITFGLQGLMRTGESFDIAVAINLESDRTANGYWLSEGNKKSISDAVKPKVDEFIAKKATRSGMFMYPFFVRYAYRLYDNSLTMHSAPCLMVCSSDLSPQCFVDEITYDADDEKDATTITNLKVFIASACHQLDYAVSYGLDNLSSWKDIVKSVDVFVSNPITSYDSKEEIGDIVELDISDSYSICKAITEEGGCYQKHSFLDMYRLTKSSNYYPEYRVMLPKRSEESFKKDLSESSLFYLLKSINIDELKTERTIIPIGNDYLESLVAREVLNDDYISHDTLIPSYANTYNSRLNIINVKRKLFDGYKPNTLQSYTNGYMTDNVTLGTLSYKIYFHIRQEGNEIVVANDSLIGNMTPLLWLYYPNRNAYKAIVELNSYNNPTRYEVSLEPHPFLNGAYYMADWDGFNNSNFLAQASPITTSKKTIDVRNVIFASDVNNPFRFPAVGSYTIDTDEIYNVSTSAKALSQGQFGQFPLYAFCSDGIWALEVASDGTFSAKQPISRDVCNNADSITQIDGAVVFTTDQGLKLIQGSEVTLLSGAMDGHNVDEHTYFPENFFDKKGYGEYDNLVVQETRDFRKILKTCRIAYDYPNNMLRIFPKDKVGNVYKYYVYDLTTGEYGSAIEGEEVSAVVPSYPTSMVQKGASVFTFDNVSDNDTIRKGLLLTRPVMFSEPSSLKKINELKLHYTKHHEGTKVRMVMYVSNDSKNWVEVKSLRHGSYKYYRFGLVTNMTDDDALSGMVARYELTRTNKLR